MDSPKYLILKKDDVLGAVMFAASVKHVDEAESHKAQGFEVLRAGLFEVGAAGDGLHVRCWGESQSMRDAGWPEWRCTSSPDKDAAILKAVLE